VPLIGVPALPQPSPMILNRATISASPSGIASALSFPVEEHVPFNSSCYSSIVVHHSEDPISSPILPLTPASLSPPTTDVAIPAQISPTMFDVATDSQPQQNHSMITRSLNNIHKPKQFHVVTKHPLPHAIEPSCVSQALGDPRWRQAMSAELTALMRHNTWTLVPSPKHCHPIGCNRCFGLRGTQMGRLIALKRDLLQKVSINVLV